MNFQQRRDRLQEIIDLKENWLGFSQEESWLGTPSEEVWEWIESRPPAFWAKNKAQQSWVFIAAALKFSGVLRNPLRVFSDELFLPSPVKGADPVRYTFACATGNWTRADLDKELVAKQEDSAVCCSSEEEFERYFPPLKKQRFLDEEGRSHFLEFGEYAPEGFKLVEVEEPAKWTFRQLQYCSSVYLPQALDLSPGDWVFVLNRFGTEDDWKIGYLTL